MFGDGSEIYPFPAYMVQQDTCSRVRVAVLMSEVQHIEITIASHTMTVLAVDGAGVGPMKSSYIVRHIGERIDFQLCADQTSGTSFDIIAKAPELCDPARSESTGQPGPETCRIMAQLNYSLSATEFTFQFLRQGSAPIRSVFPLLHFTLPIASSASVTRHHGR